MKKTMIFIFLMMMTGFTFAGGYELGDKADDFLLKNVDGTMISMSKYQDVKGFIVIFTCNHCPYSKAYEDRIIALDKKYKSEGFPVLAINPNDPEMVPEDSFENMKINAKEKGFTFPYLFDADQKVYPLYGATRTPHVFLLNKEEGDLIVRYIGAIDNNHTDASKVTESYLEDAVDALLEGGTPDPGYTKAIGCSIKNKASKK
ncbi:MAG: thioredoxin family protein [Bacteroidetes bacterium]|nr:thioredoxin family protein [Bacteroidota bacterium]